MARHKQLMVLYTSRRCQENCGEIVTTWHNSSHSDTFSYDFTNTLAL